MTPEELQRLIDAATEPGDDEPLAPHLDGRWDALAAGTLDAEDAAALAALAADDPGAQAALEAFRPLGDAFIDGALESLPLPAPPRRRRRQRRAVWAALGGLAAAAAALLAVLQPDPTLPDYDVAVLGGDQVVRGAEAATRRYAPGSRITIRLLPAHPHAEDVSVRVALDRWDQPLAVAPERADNGAVQLRGTVGEGAWDLPPGVHRVLLAVGPSSTPFSPEPPWQVSETTIEIGP